MHIVTFTYTFVSESTEILLNHFPWNDIFFKTIMQKHTLNLVFGLRACLRMWKLSNKLSESQVEFTSTLCADPMTPPNGKCRRHLPLNVISFRRFFARWTSVSMVTTIVAFWRKNESSGFQKKPRPWMKSSCDLNCDSCVWCHFSILKKVRQKIVSEKGIFFLYSS